MSELVTRRYSFKLYPNAEQLSAIEDQAVLLARLWNAALQQREDQWRLLLTRDGECKRSCYKELIRREKRIVTVEKDRRVIPLDRKKELTGISFVDQARKIKHIRAEFPEYAAMSSASLSLCLAALDLAFVAFWRRMREGAGAEAGYPRYKSSRYASTIWHRDGSGWKMRPHGKHWKFRFRGIPGEVKGRGRFPVHSDAIRSMEIFKRSDGWFASVVVKLQPRQKRGQKELEVNLDLLDHFASVKTGENGECLPGEPAIYQMVGAQIIPALQGAYGGSDAVTSQMQGDGRAGHSRSGFAADSVTSQMQGDGRLSAWRSPETADAVTSQTVDELKSHRDRRFRKFSYRWRAETKRIAKLEARIARRRKESLHRWTTAIVRDASSLVVIAPPIKENTESARGDAINPGACVDTVAELNRNTLEQAPATAVNMLKYKAIEAGVCLEERRASETKLVVGRDLPATKKKIRRTRRAIMEN